ncbi:HEAT repeat domain-containing protein, partial [Sphingorhabdus sp.]
AAGNSGDLTLLPIVSELLDDPSPLVRGAAIWALAELNPAVFKSQLANRQATELDESVRDEWFSAASAH